MKHLLQLLLLSFLLFAFLPAYAQTPEPCQGDVFFPADPCADACLFNCFIDGFKGNTGGFTPDTGIVFCGTIETSQWFAFTASTAQTTLTAMPSLCIFGNGVQISVYSDCHGSPIPNGCNAGGSGGGDFPVSVTVDLVPGDIYYLMIDGYAGDLCDFTLEVSPSEAIAGYVHTQTIELCAYETIDIQGQPYTAPDTVRIATPAITGCDSVEIYYLKSRETVVNNQTLTFCPGESITLNGSVYSQETTVTDTVSNPAGCDTINIYTLKYTLDPADCPSCSETFMKIIGSAGQQVRGYGVYEAGDGNLYVTGTVQDSALLMKIYPGGGLIWSRSFDIVPGLIDNIAEILEDSDGMIAGAGQAGDLQPGVTGFAFRYDPVSDQMLWVKTFSDESPYVMGILEKEPGGNFIVYSNPHEPVNNAGLTEINRSTGDFTAAPMSVRLDLGAADNFNSALIINGSMYGVGRFTNGSSFTDMRHLLARIDVSNSDITYATLNHVPPGSPARLYGMDLVFDNITKVIYSVAFGDETGENLNNSHVFLHSTYNSGSLAWTKKIDIEEITSESVDEIVSVPDGFILYCRNLAAPPGNLYLIKTDKSGNLVWSKKVDFGFNDNFPAVSTAQSQILVKGDYLYFTATATDESGNSRMMLFKTTLDATLEGDCSFISNTPVTVTDVLSPKTWAVDLTRSLPAPEFLPATPMPRPTALTDKNACKVFVSQALEISLCPGESILIGGIVYNGPGTATDTIAGTAGCDTIRTYTIKLLPLPERSETVSLCPGESVSIGGVVYQNAGTVTDTLPGLTGCDTIVHYTLVQLENPARMETVSFCPGTSVVIGGVVYQNAGTVTDTLPGLTGCDTIVHYTLVQLENPARMETVSFCPGASVVIGGQTYTQPGVVVDTLPAGTGCDTIVMYTLQYSITPGATVSINCPDNVDIPVSPGTGPVNVPYDLPSVSGDCDCPGIALMLIQGPPSGGVFPVGSTQVCYQARDSCGNTAACCFQVTIREESGCDIKTNGCIRYELLGITRETDGDLRYKIRVQNLCSNKLIYTAIQIPDGLAATSPADNTVFTAQSNRAYDVRNPNASPFHSIRFKSKADSIANGQSDIFEYAIPGQTAPSYIHVTTRLYPQLFYEAHLNTFYCPVVQATGSRSNDSGADAVDTASLKIFPNPTSGRLFADLSAWRGSRVSIRIYNSQGQRVHDLRVTPEQDLQVVDLPEGLSAGLYLFELLTNDGEKRAIRFVFQ